jgi:hypothetical protein
MKKLSVVKRHRRFKNWKDNVQDDPRSGESRTQRIDALRSKMRLVTEEGYCNMFGGKDPNSGLTDSPS